MYLSIFTLLWADKFHVAFDSREIIRKSDTVGGSTDFPYHDRGLHLVWKRLLYVTEYTKYHDMSYFQTMVTQIKSVEGYSDDLPLALVGNEITDETNNMGSLVGGTFGLGGKSESNISAYSRNQIITKYLGFAPRFCGYEEIVALMDNEEVQQMPSYPDDGSIKIVDGVIVVKLME